MEARRPRLLFLSQCLPFPPHSGVTNRTFNILKQLAKEFEVSLVAFSRRNHQPSAESRSHSRVELSRIVHRVFLPAPIPSEWSPLRKVAVHLSSVLSGSPYTKYDYRSSVFASELEGAIATGPFDFVHLDSLDLFDWIPKLPHAAVACTHHNIESELLRLRATRTHPPLLGRYVGHQARLMQHIESKVSTTLALNVVTSDIDGARLRRLAPGARVLTVPNGVDTDYFSPQSNVEVEPNSVAFLGPSYMLPNRDGVEYFLDAMWPRVRQQVPTATLRLIGRISPQDKRRFETRPGVTALGYVPDVRHHLAAASVCIVPLRIGGGTRLKILDSWAMGNAVVSTSIGCEGLEAKDGENILVRDDPKEFAQATTDVMRDAQLRAHLGAGARRTAELRYSWDALGRTLCEAYQRLLVT